MIRRRSTRPHPAQLHIACPCHAGRPRRRPPGTSASHPSRSVSGSCAVPASARSAIPREPRSGPEIVPERHQVAGADRARRSTSRARAAAASSSRAPRAFPRETTVAVQLDLERRGRGPSRGRRRGAAAAAGSCAAPRRARSSSSASGVTQAEIEVGNDLPRNGPSGTYSHAWMSRALQSLTSTTPKTCSANALGGTGSPRARHADDEAELELDVEPSRRAEHGALGVRRLQLPVRPDDVGAADDDRAGAAVVADRQPAPVRQQRLGVGPEHAAEVRRVLERRVEVDVVRRPRTAVATVASAVACAARRAARGSERLRPSRRARAPAARFERRLARRRRRAPTRSTTSSPSAPPHPRRPADRLEKSHRSRSRQHHGGQRYTGPPAMGLRTVGSA